MNLQHIEDGDSPFVPVDSLTTSDESDDDLYVLDDSPSSQSSTFSWHSSTEETSQHPPTSSDENKNPRNSNFKMIPEDYDLDSDYQLFAAGPAVWAPRTEQHLLLSDSEADTAVPPRPSPPSPLAVVSALSTPNVSVPMPMATNSPLPPMSPPMEPAYAATPTIVTPPPMQPQASLPPVSLSPIWNPSQILDIKAAQGSATSERMVSPSNKAPTSPPSWELPCCWTVDTEPLTESSESSDDDGELFESAIHPPLCEPQLLRIQIPTVPAIPQRATITTASTPPPMSQAALLSLLAEDNSGVRSGRLSPTSPTSVEWVRRRPTTRSSHAGSWRSNSALSYVSDGPPQRQRSPSPQRTRSPSPQSIRVLDREYQQKYNADNFDTPPPRSPLPPSSSSSPQVRGASLFPTSNNNGGDEPKVLEWLAASPPRYSPSTPPSRELFPDPLWTPVFNIRSVSPTARKLPPIPGAPSSLIGTGAPPLVSKDKPSHAPAEDKEDPDSPVRGKDFDSLIDLLSSSDNNKEKQEKSDKLYEQFISQPFWSFPQVPGGQMSTPFRPFMPPSSRTTTAMASDRAAAKEVLLRKTQDRLSGRNAAPAPLYGFERYAGTGMLPLALSSKLEEPVKVDDTPAPTPAPVTPVIGTSGLGDKKISLDDEATASNNDAIADSEPAPVPTSPPAPPLSLSTLFRTTSPIYPPTSPPPLLPTNNKWRHDGYPRAIGFTPSARDSRFIHPSKASAGIKGALEPLRVHRMAAGRPFPSIQKDDQQKRANGEPGIFAAKYKPPKSGEINGSPRRPWLPPMDSLPSPPPPGPAPPIVNVRAISPPPRTPSLPAARSDLFGSPVSSPSVSPVSMEAKRTGARMQAPFRANRELMHPPAPPPFPSLGRWQRQERHSGFGSSSMRYNPNVSTNRPLPPPGPQRFVFGCDEPPYVSPKRAYVAPASPALMQDPVSPPQHSMHTSPDNSPKYTRPISPYYNPSYSPFSPSGVPLSPPPAVQPYNFANQGALPRVQYARGPGVSYDSNNNDSGFTGYTPAVYSTTTPGPQPANSGMRSTTTAANVYTFPPPDGVNSVRERSRSRSVSSRSSSRTRSRNSNMSRSPSPRTPTVISASQLPVSSGQWGSALPPQVPYTARPAAFPSTAAQPMVYLPTPPFPDPMYGSRNAVPPSPREAMPTSQQPWNWFTSPTYPNFNSLPRAASPTTTSSSAFNGGNLPNFNGNNPPEPAYNGWYNTNNPFRNAAAPWSTPTWSTPYYPGVPLTAPAPAPFRSIPPRSPIGPFQPPPSWDTNHYTPPGYLNPTTSCTPLTIFHPRYYFADGTVAFRVDGMLYKVHRYFFDQHSSFFHTLLQSYVDWSGTITSPVYLADVQKVDFDRFLSIFYPSNFLERDLTTVEEWSSVLKLASRWMFKDIRALAISKLAVIASPIDRIALGKRHGVQEWLGPALTQLCMRGSPLTMEEAEKLGMEDVVKMMQLQHDLFWQIPREELDDDEVLKKVQERFGLSINTNSNEARPA